MPTLFNHKMLMALWAGVVLALFTLFGSPLTLVTGSLLFFTAIAPPAGMLMLQRGPSLSLAESISTVLHPVDRSRTE